MDKDNRPVHIEDLNKTQLVLLVILLSFVTSIAAAIIASALVQRASPAVNQTINRVVQRTIEKVVPDYTPGKVQTVVVKEDDLVVDAVAKARAGIMNIFVSKESTEPIGRVISLGGGLFLSGDVTAEVGKTYIVHEGKTFFEASATAVSPLGLTLFTSSDPAAKNLSKISFAKDADTKPGQTAIVVSDTSIQKSLIQQMYASKDDAATRLILLSPLVAQSSIGSVVTNLDGDTIGIVVPRGESAAMVVAADAVQRFVQSPTKTAVVQGAP